MSADGPSQSEALSPPVSITSSSDLLLQSENTSNNQTSPPIPATPVRSSGANSFEERLIDLMSNLREEQRQDREEVRARFATLERNFAAVNSARAASSARSMSPPLPSRSGSTEHFQQIRADNGNGK